MRDLIQLLLFVYLASLGFWRIRRFYTAPLDRYAAPESSETVSLSVIIPARNEEQRLPALLDSLQNQTIKPQEIIVVDDGSTDGTEAVARRYNCRVVHPEDPDWSGKSAACYAGARAATGEYVLFFDADVYLAADALEYVYRYRKKDRVVSIQPYHYMERTYEQCSLYFNLVAILGLDLGRWRHPFNTQLGFFGPCVLMDRDTYLATGGHSLVRDSILEDMALGQALAKLHIPLLALPHNNRLSFRMYAEGFKKLFDGWSKNMGIAAQRSSLWTILIISAIMALSFFIPGQLLIALVSANLPFMLLYGATYVLFAGLLFVSSRRIGAFWFWSCLCFPLFASFFILVLVRSLVMQLFNIPIEWRGRRVNIR
jgi:4,4'-diaponeurosporenoate glycosyltransferase